MDPMDDLMLSPDSADPNQFLQQILDMASSTEAAKSPAVGMPRLPRQNAPARPPIAAPQGVAPMSSASPDDHKSNLLRIIQLIAPAIGSMVAGGGNQQALFWDAYTTRQREIQQERDKQKAQAGTYALDAFKDLQSQNDPDQFRQLQGLYAQHAPAGVRDEIASLRFPTNRLDPKTLSELSATTQAWVDAHAQGDPNVAHNTNAVLRLPGANRDFPLAEGVDHTYASTVDPATGQRTYLTKPKADKRADKLERVTVTGADGTPKTVFASWDPDTRKWYDAQGKAMGDVSPEPLAPKEPETNQASPAAQFKDLLEVWKLKHQGQDPPADIRMQLRAEANRVNDKPTEVVAPTDLSGAVDAVMAHRMAPSQAVAMIGGYGKEGAAAKRALTRAILLKNPNFDFEDAEANYQFGKSTGTQTTVRYLDNIKTSIDILRKASADFKRTDVNVVNKAIAAGSGQFGSTDVAVYNMARTVVADEIAKVLQGGGTGNSTSDAKLKQASALLDSGYSDSQLNSVLDAAQTMLDVRRKTLTKNTFLDKSGASGGATHRFNPATGKVEAVK